MFISDNQSQECLESDEGCTQGDVAAMALYALGISPLINKLANVVDNKKCKQVWYADDSSSAGILDEIKKWWDALYIQGPKYGYFPKPSKTILVVKDGSKLQYAKNIFEGTSIKIVTDGERHLGAVIGSNRHKESYSRKKIDKWVKDIEELS